MKKSPLIIIFVTVFIDLIGFGIVLPLMPYYAKTYGATGIHVGLLMTGFSLMQFLFAPAWGKLSDRIGRRPIILLGLFGSAASYLVFATAHSLAMLYASRILAGIAGANISTAQAYIADSTTPDNRAKGMGLIGAAFGLGFIFGPAIGGSLSHFGYAAPGFFASALSFLNFLAACVVLPESLQPGASASHGESALQRFHWRNYAAALARPRMGILLGIFFFATLAFANMESMFALYVQKRFGYEASDTGYIFAYIGIVAIVIQGGLIGRLVRLFGEPRLIVAGCLLTGAGISFLSFAPAGVGLMAVLTVMAIGSAINHPSVQALVSKSAEASKQGGVLGVAQSLASLARILGPLLGGSLFDLWDYHASLLTAGGCMGIAFLLSLRHFRMGKLGADTEIAGAAS